MSLIAPAAAIAAEIQTDLWVYNDGDTVTVTGIEFGPNETVELVTTDPAGTEVDRGTAVTDEAGSFSYQFVLSVTVAGIYDVVGTGLTSGLTAGTQFDPPPDAPASLRFIDSRDAAGAVALTWEPVQQNATCYFVYRSTTQMAPRAELQANISCSSPPARTNRIAVVQDPTVTFVDATALSGQAYFYFVTAIKPNNSNQGESVSSNQVATSSLTTSPASGAFGSQAAGSTSAPKPFTISNLGPTAITFRAIVKSGPNGADFTVTGAPATGTSIAAGGSFSFNVTFTPAATASRTATLSVNASDPAHGTTTSVFNAHLIALTGTGEATNRAPTAVDDTATTLEDTAKVFPASGAGSLVGNDTDPDGDSLSVTAVSNPVNGSVGVVAGVVTFTPAADACTPTEGSFDYTVSDGSLSDTGHVTVSITCVNDAPMANGQPVTPDEDAVDAPITLTGSTGPANESGQVLTYVLDTLPGHGVLRETAGGSPISLAGTLADAALFYSPAADYCGSDSFTFHVVDNGGTANGGIDTSTTATVSIDVQCVNDAPVVIITGGPTSVDESGTTEHTYNFAASDADLGDTITVAAGYPSCGAAGELVAGSLDTATGAFRCLFVDGPLMTTVSIRVQDEAGALSDPAERDVAIKNVAPTATLANSGPIAEGGSGTVSFSGQLDPSPTDTTAGFKYSYDFGNDGTFDLSDTTVASASIPSALLADGPAKVTVRTRIADKDGGYKDYTTIVEVLNVNPSVVVSGDLDVDEGNSATFAFDTSDPGQDTFSVGTPDCGSGAYIDDSLVFDSATGDGSFDCFFADDSPSGTAADLTTVEITITDSDGGPGSGSHVVRVDNVAPAVEIAGTTDADEGDIASYTFSVVDVDADTFVLDSVSCGTLGAVVGMPAFDTETGQGSFVCSFADDDPTGTSSDPTTLEVTLHDDDTGEGSDTHLVTIHNVAPVVTITGFVSVDEGATNVEYEYTVADVGALDTFPGFSEPDCGTTGTYVVDSLMRAGDDASGSFLCDFPDDDPTGTSSDPTTISITIVDDDAGEGTGMLEVTVHNIAPVVTIAGDASADEGQSKTYTFSVVDVDADTFVLDSVSCGTLGVVVGMPAFDTETGQGSFVCSFADDAPTGTAQDPTTLEVKLHDDDTGEGSDTHLVTIHNVAPVVTITDGAIDVDEGAAPTTYSYTFTDPGADTWTHVASCGSNGVKSSDLFNAATHSGSFACTWADDDPTGTAADAKTVSVRVDDDDLGSHTAYRTVSVHNVAPVVGAVSVSFNPVTHVLTATVAYSDVGVLDTHTANATWSVPGASPSVAVNSAAKTVTATQVLGSGCYNSVGLTITVTDDDTGATPAMGALTGPADAYLVQFRPPIKDDVRNIAKPNSTIPVKVVLNRMCGGGGTATDVDLYVTIAAGASAADMEGDESNLVMDAGASNDNGQKMRVADGGYIYNFSTKGLSNTSDYTLRIRLGGIATTNPIVKTAVIRTQK